MDIRKKISLWMVAVAVIPVVLSITIITLSSSKLTSEALRNSATKQLISIRDARKSQLEDYLHTIQNEALTLSQNELTKSALIEFSKEFQNIDRSIILSNGKNELQRYYNEEFGKEYSKHNVGQSISTSQLLMKYEAWHRGLKMLLAR